MRDEVGEARVPAGGGAGGVRSMQLEVRASNESRARAFYRRLGFRDVFVREGFYDFPADDAVVMAKELEP